MKTARIILAVLIVVAIASGAYAAPVAGGKNRNPAQKERQPNWWPGEKPGMARNSVGGIVDSISATAIAVKNKEGVKTFAINEKTRVRVRGEKATVADVKVGNQVMVRFAVVDNSSVALGITVPKPSFGGEIKSIQGDVITVQSRDNVTRTIIVSAQTKYRSHGYIGSITDLRIGYRAMAVGDVSGDEMKADTVEFMPTMAKGTVTAVEGSTITIKTLRQAVISFQAGNGTVVLVRPRVGPNQKGTLADVKVGSPVNAGFHENANAAGTLLWIDVLTGM